MTEWLVDKSALTPAIEDRAVDVQLDLISTITGQPVERLSL